MSLSRRFPGSLGRPVLAAALLVLAIAPDVQEAAAGTAVASFRVTARVVPASIDGCRGAGNPVTLTCGSPVAPTILQTRPDMPGTSLFDGWITYGERAEAYDSVYAASLTTRVIRYEQWEYIETLVSW